MKPYLQLVVIAGILLVPIASRAELADRDKPVHIEADKVTVDDVKKVQTFDGNVQMVKGTLIIRAPRIVVTQDENGYQRGVATGTPSVLPRFRQKREGVDEYIEGEAERIEHDAKLEKTEFFNRAWVKSGLDEVRGQFISYDAKSENYFVTSGPDGTRAKPGSGDRVRAVIQPKNKDAAAAAPTPATAPMLKGAQNITPRQETTQ
ncbi:MAG: lipopolysaccharide transport periplasmic protein LptA [Burkholderiaceae bacterium]|nr:lipopolysaccharide transport periplasmic protein LptA [Sulfuritalea sp.]MCF8176405.1 lipopolysaccharide transport periplasmic protein LptA [Burkholderiaceae bacterium]